MALRLIEMVLQEKDGGEIHELLKEHKVLEHKQIRLPDGEVLVRILLDAELNEAVLDLLEKTITAESGSRIVILPVEATLPRVEMDEPTEAEQSEQEEVLTGRIGREELYEDIKDAAKCSRVYLVMVALSTIVAAVGMHYNSVAIIIGAMVIAPLLGPNVALSLSTALGDLGLLRHSLLTLAAGIATTMVLSVIIGIFLNVDPATHEMATRNVVAIGDIVVALAAGMAGTLAFTSGVSVTLIGVMVAVALLPPLVVSGLLLGGGHHALAMGALSLFMMNLICVNLAGVTTFLVQGIRPATWWEKSIAVKAMRISISLWGLMLAALIAMILLLREG